MNDVIVGVVLAVLAFLLIVAQWGILLNLMQQNGRLLGRLEAIEGKLAALGTSGAGGVPAATPPVPAQPGLRVGTAAPAFSLSGIYGEVMTLDALRAAGKPLLLVFTDPHCGPCNALMPDIGRWQKERPTLNIVTISRGSPDDNRAKSTQHGISQILLQKDYEVANAYEAGGTPSAVLVRADGRIGSPLAAGPVAIRELVEREMRSAAPAPAPNGKPLPLVDTVPYPLPAVKPPNGAGNGATGAHAGSGGPAPAFSLPDLDGRTVSLADFRGRDVALVFWNTGCGFCKKMLPDLQPWEQRPPAGAPELVVISSGPAEDVRALGLRSTVLLDPNFQVGPSYNANGTPMGVLIDKNGALASEPGSGAPGVFALIGSGPTGAAAAAPAAPAAAVGQLAPSLMLPDVDGRTVNLADFRGRKIALIFWNTGCGFCKQMLPDLKAWEQNPPADAPELVVISSGPTEDIRAMELRSTVLLDPNFQAGPAFGAGGTPMGVLIDPDGRIASETGAGAPGVFSLIGGGPSGGSAPAARPPSVRAGAPAPSLKLPDLKGKTVNLSDFRGSPTLLVFWNTGCGFCKQMLPDLKAWERNKPRNAPRLVVISAGPIEEIRAMGLESKVLLDSEFHAGGAFGAGGTPMGVLLDAQGNVASEVVAGAPAVFSLAGGSPSGAPAA